MSPLKVIRCHHTWNKLCITDPLLDSVAAIQDEQGSLTFFFFFFLEKTKVLRGVLWLLAKEKGGKRAKSESAVLHTA